MKIMFFRMSFVGLPAVQTIYGLLPETLGLVQACDIHFPKITAVSGSLELMGAISADVEPAVDKLVQ